MALICPNCGNTQDFLVKTAQMHVVHVHEGRVDVAEETRPTVFEVLCDKCDSELNLEECDEMVRKELLLTVGAA
jgi:Zn finger protein HypA/HybF involved in hydrogenase expression